MTSTSAIIDDLSRPFPETAVGTRWQLVSDAVMGGISSGHITSGFVRDRRAIRMQGSVSLENNGGFLQIALDLASGGRTVDASGFLGIAIDVLGDGEAYGLHLRTPDLTRPWQSYRAGFVASEDWKTLLVPFGDFISHRTAPIFLSTPPIFDAWESWQSAGTSPRTCVSVVSASIDTTERGAETLMGAHPIQGGSSKGCSIKGSGAMRAAGSSGPRSW